MRDVLITGRGTSGSWQIRGAQLGAAIGAHVEPRALDVAGYRMAVVVKRTPDDLLKRLQQADVPIVWDVVDAWPQPRGNVWGSLECTHWLRGALRHIQPAAIVAATEHMASDIRRLTKVPVLALPHHARPNQPTTPIREHVKVVGYEGAEHYLGHWATQLEHECARRGWRFVVNPPDWRVVDIGIALRDAEGYAARHWKSNVKLANMQAAGTPCVLSPEAGYKETASEGGAEMWAMTSSDLRDALDVLASPTVRAMTQPILQSATIPLATVAATYTQWLNTLKF